MAHDDAYAFRTLQLVTCHCYWEELGDMETVSDLAYSCDRVQGKNYGCGYVHDRSVVRSVNVNADCHLIVLPSGPSGCLQDIGGWASASESVNEGGYVHGHGYGSLPMLAEHKMKPFCTLEISCDSGKSYRAVKPVQDPPLFLPAYVA